MEHTIESLASLKALAKSMFEAYPAVETFFVTSDNQFFTEEFRTHAESHQRIKDEQVPVRVITRAKANQEDPWLPAGAAAPMTASKGGEATVPSGDNTKEEIASWLKSKGVEADVKVKKDDLLAKVKEFVISTTSSLSITEVPGEESTEAEIKAFLKEKNVEFAEVETKTELLAKVGSLVKSE